MPRVDEFRLTIRELKRTVASLSSTVEAKDAMITSLRSQISEHNDQMSQLLTGLQGKDETILALQCQLSSEQKTISEQNDQIGSLLGAASTAESRSDIERQLAKANEDYQRLHADYEATLSRDLIYHKAKAEACQGLAGELEASQSHVAQLEEQLFTLQSQFDREQENFLKLVQSFSDNDSLPQQGSSEASLAAVWSL
jgi:chromosome segregation ATPase